MIRLNNIYSAFLIGFLFNCHSFVFAQNEIEYKKYIPLDSSSQEFYPTIEIKTVIHIIQRFENDAQNLTKDSIAFIEQQFEWVNTFYRKLEPPILPTSDGITHYIPDARVHFKIDRIEFHVNDYDWDRIKTIVEISPANPMYILEILEETNEIKIAGKWAHRIKNYADSLRIINGGENNGVYHSAGTREVGNFTFIKLDKKIVTQTEMGQMGYYRESNRNCDMDLLEKYADGDRNALHVFYTGSSKSGIAFGCGPAYNFLNVSNLLKGGGWAGAQLTAHELGHTIGLYHTDYPQFSDLPKTDKFGFIDCNTTLTSNNIMGYNKCRTYLSPLQVGYVHYLHTTSPDRIRITNSNEYDANKTVVIYNDTVWDKAMVIRGDIIVKRNTTLTLNNQIHLASGSKIYLEKRAKIILKDGDITNFFNTPWQGVVLVTDYNFRKKAPKKEKNRGKIIFEGKGKLRNYVE